MMFVSPVPFREAIAAADAKSLLLTSGRTRDLQKFDGDLKRRSLFSATVQVAQPLQILSSGLMGINAGKVDQATVRLAIKQTWEKLGYKPDPEQIGSMLDLGSDRRINLQIETNVATTRGAGWYEQGQNAEVLDEFPAWELYDTAPGGEGRRKDIPERWVKAGGKFFGDAGLMIALVDDPVWEKLGDPELFGDGLGNPFAPYWFNSKWRTRDRTREDAIAFGLIDADTQIEPQPLDLNENLQATPDVRDAGLRRDLEQTGLGRFVGDVFRFRGGSA